MKKIAIIAGASVICLTLLAAIPYQWYIAPWDTSIVKVKTTWEGALDNDGKTIVCGAGETHILLEAIKPGIARIPIRLVGPGRNEQRVLEIIVQEQPA